VNGFRLRDWTPADEPDVEALWRLSFPAPRGGQNLSWLFRPGPAGPAVRVVAELSGRIVSHAGVASGRFRLAGELVRGGYSVAAMTAPEFQGRGLYARLGDHLYGRLEREGFAFVAGFSNQRSHRLMADALGRVVIGPFPWCVRPLVPRPKPWRPDSPGLQPADERGARVVPCAPDDARLDALWDRVAPSFTVGQVRDAAFGAWRFATRPDAGYESWLAEDRRGDALGSLVLRLLAMRGLRFGFVVELVVDPAAPEAGAALLRVAARRIRTAGGVALSALLPGAGPVRRVLRRAGFVRVPERLHPQTVRFSVRGLGRFAGHAALTDPDAWWLSWADTDLV
jgi:hypothetical protein